MKTMPKIDLVGENIRSRAYGEWSVATLRIGDQYENGDFPVKHCAVCESKGEKSDWSPAQSKEKGVRKSYKYRKGWGFGLRLKREVCPECEERTI